MHYDANANASCAESINSQNVRSQGNIKGRLVQPAWHGLECLFLSFLYGALDTECTKPKPFSSSSATAEGVYQSPPLSLSLLS